MCVREREIESARVSMQYAFVLCLFNLHIYCCAVQKINIFKAIFSSLEESMLVFVCCEARAFTVSMCTVCINSVYSLDNRGVYFCIQIFEFAQRRTSNINVCLCESNGFMHRPHTHTRTHIHGLTECGIHYFSFIAIA